MSDSARDAIFKAIDGDTTSSSVDRDIIEQQARDLLIDPDAIRPSRTTDDVVDAFINRINSPKVAATATRISSLQQLPHTIQTLLTERSRPCSISLQPIDALTALDWTTAGITQDAEIDDGIAVGLALWGIAETGSLVVHSATNSPILLHFLPAVSIVAVPASHLLWHLEDYAAAARQAGDEAPRNACLITGASGTTDIEGRLVTGAHGPRELHVIIFD